MIEEHVDPTTETHAQISNLIRTLVTAAAGVAEKRAQRREAEQREAARQSDITRQAFEERMRAEREIAYLIYRNVERDRWWERATPKDIADTVEVAGTWATTDPRAQAAINRVKEELHHRYGIDLQDGATPTEVLNQVEAARQAARGGGHQPAAARHRASETAMGARNTRRRRRRTRPQSDRLRRMATTTKPARPTPGQRCRRARTAP